jgi:hypothetical protein
VIKTSVQSSEQKEVYESKRAKIGKCWGLLADESEGEVRADALSGTQQREGERRAGKDH